MDTIVTNAIAKGMDYLKQHGRQVEQSLYAYFFEGGFAEAVIDALAAYQNEDGGFGHAFEPDMRCPASSTLATTEAVAWLWQIGIQPDHEMVRKAVQYLIQTYQLEEKSWLFIPQESQEYAHAPWWQFSPEATATKHNPRPQILGIFLRARDQVPSALLAELQEDVVAAFLQHVPEMKMHDLFNYLRLYRTPDLPMVVQEPLVQHLPAIVRSVVSMEEEAWSGYVLRPYGVLENLDDEFLSIVADALPVSLVYLVNEQYEDGSWPLTWNWGDTYPDVWPVAEKEWKSIVTLDNIRFLQSLGAVVSS
jgi:hypothetical protein